MHYRDILACCQVLVEHDDLIGQPVLGDTLGNYARIGHEQFVHQLRWHQFARNRPYVCAMFYTTHIEKQLDYVQSDWLASREHTQACINISFSFLYLNAISQTESKFQVQFGVATQIGKNKHSFAMHLI